MATATTKLELTQLLAARNSELEAARLRISVLEGEVEMLRTKRSGASNVRTSTYTPRAPSAEQLAFRAQMAAAKELAARTGRTVKVGE